MALKFNKNSNEFYLVSNNRAKAQEVGLTQSAKAKGPNGEAVWFTDSPYAALCFYEEAEGVAREKLEPLHMDYMASMANEWPYSSKRCPEGMEFMPFQNAGIDYALNRPNALVGDAMGLGKTMQGIGVANELGATKVIVVCPGAVRLNWQREIKNWSVIPNVSSYPILKSADGVNPYANYVIVSYDLLRNEHILHTIANMQWDLAILDEGHYLKSIDAKRTQATFGTSDRGSFHDHYLVKNAQMILPLTGTPLPNRPRECFGNSVKVLTDKGWKRIVDVAINDQLWDGEEWVNHEGLLYQGYAKTVSVGKISVTGTHLFRDKFTWVKAEEVIQNTDTLRRVLEKGSDHLPLRVSSIGTLEQLKKLYAIATAVVKQKQQSNGLGTEERLDAGHVEQKKESKVDILNIKKYVPMMKLEETCLTGSQGSFKDATTPTIQATIITEKEVSKYIKSGGIIEKCFWNILFHFKDIQIKSYQLIELITIKGMFPEIFNLSRIKKIWGTGDLLLKCKKKLTGLKKKTENLEDVYDIANAGPRNRFTVLTNKGPVIAHNCYTLTRGLCWEAIDWQSYESFMYRYNPSGRTSRGHNFEMRGRLPELRARLRCNFMVRRLKEDVLKDLPDKRYEMTYVETNGKIKEVIAKEKMLDYDVETLKNPTAEIDGQIATVRREMGEAKVGRVIEHIKYLLDIQELEKVVIFSHHKSVMDKLKEGLNKYGVVEVRGGMTPTAKQKSVDDFVNDPKTRVWSGQIDAASTGIDGLQEVCQYAVFCEPSWTPGVNEQAVDRLHRHGQHGNVVAQLIVVENSLDERVLAANFNKTHTIHSSLDAR